MLITLKMAIMMALMTTGMEAVITPKNCIFNYDRMMPRVMTDISEQKKQTIKAFLINLEGMPCSSVIGWASGAMDSLEGAKKYDEVK